MYVCLCHGITDGQIRQAARDGADSAKEVYARYGVKPCCGSCLSSFSGLMEAGPAAGRPAAEGAG